MRKFLPLIGIITLLAVAAYAVPPVLSGTRYGLKPEFPPGFESLIPGPPKTPEGTEAEIAERILEAYRLYAYADLTFDTSKFDTVLTDDPRFPLSPDRYGEVLHAFGYVPKGAGWLTYMKAWYKNWERGANLLGEAEKKRKIRRKERQASVPRNLIR